MYILVERATGLLNSVNDEGPHAVFARKKIKSRSVDPATP